jgi:hypothetical protein
LIAQSHILAASVSAQGKIKVAISVFETHPPSSISSGAADLCPSLSSLQIADNPTNGPFFIADPSPRRTVVLPRSKFRHSYYNTNACRWSCSNGETWRGDLD